MHDELKTCGLVVACNTATAAAIHILRDDYGELWPIIGTEPGLKPAIAISAHVAVMATHSTLQSAKFRTLVEQVKKQTPHALEVFPCPCHGLAKAIDVNDEKTIDELIESYTAQVKASAAEVLVLGCTHYALVTDKIQQALPNIRILDTGEAIARRVQAVLPEQSPMSNKESKQPPCLQAWTSGSTKELEAVLQRWMPEVEADVFFWDDRKYSKAI
ncbi:MAG: glutamate racemase, partial [Saezia sp.]